ncbi:MAG: pantetheine-phosphate adenylyltransferase [Victivallaceae bacterium]|nr:pantetheine-phosphate adenylyltransferase [Victivallaceae bacterium]MDD4180949.1 pantetheine-phosphate adenylyltransferase [Victivallaceae bacterium]
MRSVLYPGSFDPPTNGHLDLICRASRLFDRVIVAIGTNIEKNPMFSSEERKTLMQKCCKDIDKVEVVSFDGLTVNALEIHHGTAILRGLRAFSDFEYELQMALMNRSLKEDCETIFMMPTANNSFVSSSMVKVAAYHGGDFSQHVPPVVAAAMKQKIMETKNEQSF